MTMSSLTRGRQLCHLLGRTKASKGSAVLVLVGLTVFTLWIQEQDATATFARLREEPSQLTLVGGHTSSTNQPAQLDTLQQLPTSNQPTVDILRFDSAPGQPLTNTTQEPVAGMLTNMLTEVLKESETKAPEEPQSNTMKQPAPNTPEPPVTSVLHPITPPQDPLNPNVVFRIKSTKAQFDEYEESFPQYGKIEPGRHYRIENTPLLSKLGNRESNSVLIICVFNDAGSWGGNRTVNDFFNLVGSFNYPKEKISISMLTSSLNEFGKVRALFANNIQHYPRLSVMFRNDFVQNGLSRDNRHEGPRQADRRRMIARYRNYVLMSSLETWHQGVLWLDADVEIIPSHLLPKMVHSGLDILMPTCYTRYHGVWINYDQNGWIGQRAVRPADLGDGEFFMPGPLNVKLLDEVEDKSKPFTPMDSVGGTMLYVRAEVHRQGVVFPMHYVIGSEWGREGYDGIETEGLCYTAHFLGFKCWGMVNESIQHTEEF